MIRSSRLAATLAAVLCAGGLLVASQSGTIPAHADGKQIFLAACVGCHGFDGKGAPRSAIGFQPPGTFPDFTACSQTTPEMNSDWKAVIREGGRFRGFSQIMPSFGEVLTSDQMDEVIHYIRGFCREPAWPRGELNFPRALITEKAFPENETTITTTINAHGAPGVTSSVVHEQRIRARNMIEVVVPVTFQDPDHKWHGGFGDAILGFKRTLFSSLRTGSIMALQGEVTIPTGNSTYGLGNGVTIFEGFAAFGQMLPKKAFVQFQVGSELPVDTAILPRALYWRTTLGKRMNQGNALGRMWAPMVELLADRDLETGAKTNWDILPQLMVTLSHRQHIRASAGVRVPVNNTAGRGAQVLFYLLWDWQDGKLTEGW
jgi:mono/diheme cytochrome c family protein